MFAVRTSILRQVVARCQRYRHASAMSFLSLWVHRTDSYRSLALPLLQCTIGVETFWSPILCLIFSQDILRPDVRWMPEQQRIRYSFIYLSFEMHIHAVWRNFGDPKFWLEQISLNVSDSINISINNITSIWIHIHSTNTFINKVKYRYKCIFRDYFNPLFNVFVGFFPLFLAKLHQSIV